MFLQISLEFLGHQNRVALASFQEQEVQPLVPSSGLAAQPRGYAGQLLDPERVASVDVATPPPIPPEA